MDSEEQVLLAEFHRLKPALSKWGSSVDKSLVEIIRSQYKESNFIQMNPMHRCKSDKSFIEKALYREKDYTNPIVEIEDKVATRVVVVTSDNVYRVKDLVINCDKWTCKITKDIRELIQEKPNLFDYQSVHLIVWPKSTIDDISPELLSCEVQIRTLSQHSYAEVSHDSIYKGPYKDNNEIKRLLAKCMALMETTDDMFCQVFSKISMADGGEDNPDKKYLIQLTRLYNELLNRHADYKNIDSDFTESVFELLHKLPVSIEDLEEYCVDNENEIKNGVLNNQSLIFEHPAVLVVFYYADYYPDFLREEWMLTSGLLRKIKAAINLSSGNY
jgi:putative GTP pyrophosphokinase